MSSLFSRYKTNTNLEQTGVILDLGTERILIARAGGSNNKYLQIMEALTKPHRRAIAAGVVDRASMEAIVRQAFAKAVVLDWQTQLDNGDFVSGIPNEQGEVLPFNEENLIAVFKELPDLFNDIQTFANDNNMYLQAALELDSKN